MNEVVKRLRELGLTKTEVYSIINLGIGLPRPASAVNGEAEGMDVEGEGEASTADDEVVAHITVPTEDGDGSTDAIIEDDTDGRELLRLVVDSLDERFPGDEGEEKILAMLKVLRDCIALPSVNGTNGDNEAQSTT